MSGSGETLPGARELAARATSILDRHWQPEGYTVPNEAVYPHQWLWDSCFHAVVWAHLGRADRAEAELRNVFAHQGRDGFVPHMTYWRAPDQHATFWGRPTTSCITQPPMYGHALAELVRLGVAVDEGLVLAAMAGLQHLVDRPRSPAGLVTIVHPWETGCDDSPRWDGWCDRGWSPDRWKETKGDLVAAIAIDDRTGSPTGSDRFNPGSVAFTALVAFNLIELAGCLVPGDAATVGTVVDELIAALASRWDASSRTFVDDGPFGSCGEPTLEALLPVLLDGPDDSILDAIFGARAEPARAGPILAGAILAGVTTSAAPASRGPDAGELFDVDAMGGACGPAQVSRRSSAYDPSRYWRGPAWPQLTYLLWLAARRHRRREAATALGEQLVRGAVRSGFAEYWHPDTGAPGGAVPQSWTTLAAVVADRRGDASRA